MRLYAQRAFVCRECDATIFASEVVDAERGTYYTPATPGTAYGLVSSTQVLEAADKHFAETGHATYREENRVIYQPQP